MDKEELREIPARVQETVEQFVHGKDDLLRLLIVGLLVGGHILVEGLPGTAKTLTSRLFAQAIGGAGGTDDVFLQHGTAEVVDAITQADLGDLRSLGNPGCLQILDVVQKQPADSNCTQVIETSRLHAVPALGIGAQIRLVRLETPGNESGEAPRLIL